MAATQPIPVRELHDLFETHLRFEFAERHTAAYVLIFRDATAPDTNPIEQLWSGALFFESMEAAVDEAYRRGPCDLDTSWSPSALPQRTATRHISLQSGVNGRFRAPVIASRSRSPHEGRDRRRERGISPFVAALSAMAIWDTGATIRSSAAHDRKRFSPSVSRPCAPSETRGIAVYWVWIRFRTAPVARQCGEFPFWKKNSGRISIS